MIPRVFGRSIVRAQVRKPHVSPNPTELLERNRHLFRCDESFDEAHALIKRNDFSLLSLAMLDAEELRLLGVKSLATRARILAVAEAAHTELFVISPTASASNVLFSGPALGVLLAVVGISVAALIIVPIVQVRSAMSETAEQIAAAVADATPSQPEKKGWFRR